MLKCECESWFWPGLGGAGFQSGSETRDVFSGGSKKKRFGRLEIDEG